MTSTLEHALRRLETVRDGFVVRSMGGSPKTDGEADHAIERIFRRAGLPVRYWHTLRHYPDGRIIPPRQVSVPEHDGSSSQGMWRTRDNRGQIPPPGDVAGQGGRSCWKTSWFPLPLSG